MPAGTRAGGVLGGVVDEVVGDAFDAFDAFGLCGSRFS
jgi:hypothetical protein